MHNNDKPLEAVNRLWLDYIELAIKHKATFDKYADEGLKFYDGPHDWIYKAFDKASEGSSFEAPKSAMGLEAPAFKMTNNRVFDLVSIYGPMLYNRNPIVTVGLRTMPELPADVWGDPYLAALADFEEGRRRLKDSTVCSLLECYLNYLSNETGMRDPVRRVTVEALIKGMGCLWVDLWRPDGSMRNMVRPTWVSVDDIVWDPDARSFQDVQWIARRYVRWVRSVERTYGYQSGYLKGMLASNLKVAADRRQNIPGEPKKAPGEGQTYDLMTYWVVYSKVGMGAKRDCEYSDKLGQDQDAIEELLKDWVQIAVAEGLDHPLNMPPDFAKKDLSNPDDRLWMQNQMSWQVPHWRDNAWPCEFLSFHNSPNSLYPLSHIKPALGQQYFLDWGYSMLISKLRIACLTKIGLSGDVDPETEASIASLKDFTTFRLPKNAKVPEMVQVLQMGDINPNAYNVLDRVNQEFNLRTGLNPAMYGQQGSTQIRSGTEARSLHEQLQIRPDDMRDQTEEFITRSFRRMALMARYTIHGHDIAPLMGRPAAYLWERDVKTTDIDAMVLEYQYRIEAGSTRKPNYDALVENIERIVGGVMPILSDWAHVNPENLKVMNSLLRDASRAHGMEFKYEIQPPAPPPPPMLGPDGMPMGPGGPMPPPGPGGPGPGGPPQGGPQGPPPGPPQGGPPMMPPGPGGPPGMPSIPPEILELMAAQGGAGMPPMM